ncbi:SCAN domain protein [Oopsacas minuta]|uniref:SCAN domain protein n=1 Tax=Oopsacas minuta TaxID=111878 RepID=A0AAV7JFD5_9METZ|nr:SCAN domain protein [Oopsacas minuta]
MCHICCSLFSNEAMELSRLKDHLNRLHPSKLNSYFKKMKANSEKQRNMKDLFANRDMRLENGLTASSNLSLMIANLEVIETVMCQSSTSVLSTIPLNNDMAQRLIDKMGDDVESQLVQILSRTDHALQIDESTARDNEALLMGYVSRHKGHVVICGCKGFYEHKEIPVKNFIQCVNDGSPAMVGRLQGLISLMKREIPGVKRFIL